MYLVFKSGEVIFASTKKLVKTLSFLSEFREFFSLQAIGSSGFLQNKSLQILENPQENTCVGVSFE